MSILKGDTTDGWWRAEFAVKGTKITRIDVGGDPNQTADAKVYIGTTLCGTLPGTLEQGKIYSIPCDAAGDYVKLV